MMRNMVDKSQISEVMAALGRRSGKARMAKLTPAQRSAIAKKAGKASGKARRKKKKEGTK
jgi:hypothetical protein